MELLEIDAARYNSKDKPKDLQDGDDEEAVIPAEGFVHPIQPKNCRDDVNEYDRIGEGLEHLVIPRNCHAK